MNWKIRFEKIQIGDLVVGPSCNEHDKVYAVIDRLTPDGYVQGYWKSTAYGAIKAYHEGLCGGAKRAEACTIIRSGFSK